ncbi:medium-chain fatty acid-CoA ligase faa2 [Coemansia sp. RSA 2603]|nr:medium-chain fatty acid-CoA ligase faa2 [Coemansia sp. RSA 2603]
MSYIVPSSTVPDCTPIYRHANYKDGTHHNAFSSATTLAALFNTAAQTYPNKHFLGTRPYYPETDTFGAYQWTTYKEAAQNVHDLAVGLDAVYASHNVDNSALGIYADARAEWVLAELAAACSSRYSVGIADYPSIMHKATPVNGAEAAINDTNMHVVVCSLDKIPRLLWRHHATPHVQVVVSMDPLDHPASLKVIHTLGSTVAELRATASAQGIALLDLPAVVQLGRQRTEEPQAAKPTACCTLTLTTDQTGVTKHVPVTHAFLSSACRSQALSLQQPRATYMADALTSVSERCLLYAMVLQGARVGFPSRGVTGVRDDMLHLRPTVVSATPALIESMHKDVVKSSINAGGITGVLARAACRVADRGPVSKMQALCSRLAFTSCARRYGGRLQTLVCSESHISADKLSILRTCLSCDVVRSYGADATGGGVLMHGVPLPGVDVRLRSATSQGFTSFDRPWCGGELMVRRADTQDEWTATGELARMRSDGRFALYGRVGHVLTSALGIHVPPEPLEAVYGGHQMVRSVVVAGSQRHSGLLGVVVPDQHVFVAWGRKLVADGSMDFGELCRDRRVVGAFARELRVYADKMDVPPYMRLDGVYLDPTPFEHVVGGVDAAGEHCRLVLLQHYKETLDRLFEMTG